MRLLYTLDFRGMMTTIRRSVAVLVSALLSVIVCSGCQTGRAGDTAAFTAGREAYDRGDFETSIRLLSEYLERAEHSRDAEAAMYVRGLSAAKSGRRQQAYSDLRRCAESSRGSAVRWRAALVLGVMYFEDNQWSEAGRAYFTAISNMPERPPMDFALWRLGQCYERTGRWSSAAAPYNQILQKFPNSDLAPRARRRIEMKPTFFSARCGTFRTAQNAQKMASDLQRQGFPASVRFEAPDGKPLHIVLVGRFDTFEAAMQQVAALQSIVPDATVWP